MFSITRGFNSFFFFFGGGNMKNVVFFTLGKKAMQCEHLVEYI